MATYNDNEQWAERVTRWLLRVVYCLAAAVIAAQVALWEEHRAQEHYCQDRLAVLAAQCREPLPPGDLR